MNAEKIFGENVYVNLDEVIETVYQCRADVADREWEKRWLEPLENLSRIEVSDNKGEWQITECYPHNVHCSQCHKRFAQTHWAVWEDGSLPRNYCPNCGARMRDDNVETD